MFKQKINIPLYIIIFSCLFTLSLSQTEILDPYLIANDTIKINTYQSTLTDEQRSSYYYWIGFRNSFYYSESEGKLAKLIKYFAPEDERYYKDLYKFGAPFFAVGCLIALCILIYLVMRFLLKKCQGPKRGVNDSFSYSTWGFIIFGFLVGIIFFSMGMYHAGKQNSIINTTLSFVEKNKEQMETVFTKMTENQAKLGADIYPTTNPGYTTKISYIDEITTEKNTLRDKYTSFASDVQKIQSPKYTFEICFLAIFILLSIVGIIGYWSRREWIPWAMSFLLLCFTVPVLYVIGLEATYAFLSIDFCQTIGNSITSGITPTDTKGLGTYFSCPSKETARSINTAIYELSTSFNVIADELNETLVTKGDTLGNGKRNNTRFEELKANYTDNATIISGLNNLVLTNNILAGLLYMSSCATTDNMINYIEEQFCYPLVDYMKYNILFNFIGVIGLLVLGIGLNKLIMIMRKNAITALRGNKKLNDEDDDDL